MQQIKHILDRVPDLVDVAARFPEKFPFLYQSTAHQAVHGRYDFLFYTNGEYLSLDNKSKLSGSGFNPQSNQFLEELDRWYYQLHSKAPVESPVGSGWCFLLSYELASQIEPVLDLPDGETFFPKALLVRTPAVIVIDHERKAHWVYGEPDAVNTVLKLLETEKKSAVGKSHTFGSDISIHEDNPELFQKSVHNIHDYISAGDVFQVNLSRQWRSESQQTAEQLYRNLSIHNPGPFAGWAQWQGASLISSSPERLVESRNTTVQTRPIAGTRPRGQHLDDDVRLAEELISHPKERAEHVMLIDLERNDLGRVCKPGTIEVDEFMVLEQYAHVHHIVSNVRGEKQDDVSPGDILAAVFPGGTITGCPKVRCMEIIAELEQKPRGCYTGSMGYLGLNGDMDSNILIRSVEMKEHNIRFNAGAGIVIDSDPYAETDETRAKAKGMLNALGANEV